jgi:iron complex transport system substrate-binding protein
MRRESSFGKAFLSKKRFVLVGLALCTMLLVSPALASDTGTLEIYGNANEDDTIDMRDLTYVKLIFFGKKPETELADAKYDGKINPRDFIQVKLIIVGQENELTVVDTVGQDVTIDKPLLRIAVLNWNTLEVMRSLKQEKEITGGKHSIATTYLAK